MDTRGIKKEQCPLRNKIIINGENSFKLWLEFEETEPWDDILNDFANIIVDTLDGRKYGLNVWTFNFLETAVKGHCSNNTNALGSYEIPPDLFVKELSRNCIEKTISDLLEKGALEDMLNASVFNLNFLDPWKEVFDEEDELERKIRLELDANHPLYGQEFEVIAQRKDQDIILVELENGGLANVQLTRNHREQKGNNPAVQFFINEQDFWKKCLKNDIANIL